MNYKHLLMAVITLCSLSASGQIAKGSLFLGGNLYLSTQNYEDHEYKTTSFGVSPAIGKAIRQNLIAGIDLTYIYQQTKRSNDTIKNSDQNIGGGIFLRKYAPIGKGFYLFGQARAGGSHKTVENVNGVGENGKGYSIDLSAYPGISYEVTRKLHLEAGLASLFYMNYSSGKYKREDGSSYRNTSFSLGTSLSNGANLSIGLRFFIPS